MSQQHWNTEIDDQGIAWLAFDKADSATNVLSEEVLEQLNTELISIASHHPIGMVLYSAKRSGFIAGADVKSFIGMSDSGEAESLMLKAHDIFNRAEALPFPTVAMIKGFCLGGGTELALAFNYRVACDDPGTRIGLPEVKLGIFPGFGGTVRSIRRMGPMAAMGMMLSGRVLRGRAAKKTGLVDALVPERHLRRAARQLIIEKPAEFAPPWTARLAGHWLLRPLMSYILNRQVSKKVRMDHYPAPFALINHWAEYAAEPVEMYASEAREVSRLLTGETAQNLIRVFTLQDDLKALGRKSEFHADRVHVIGGGVMGGDIAAWCALRGLTVSLQDMSIESLGKAIKRANTLFKRRLRDPRLVQAAMDRLIADPRGSGLRQADVIIEAIFENTEAKQNLYRGIEPIIKPNAILATNTSSIPLDELSTCLQRPERLIGLHFFNPVPMMQLVEIVTAENTDQSIADDGAAFIRQIDRLPLPVRSTPGFLVNLMPYLIEAVILESEGVPAILIDEAAVEFGMPMGPIELADTVGLDICLSVAQNLSQTLDITVPEPLRAMVDAGTLGKKTGSGFYQYKKGKAQKPRAGSSPVDKDSITQRLILRLLNESIACLREGVVTSEDLLDAGIIFGTGFAPFRGGPMHYIHQAGVEEVSQSLKSMKNRYGERFEADSGWVELPRTG